MTEPQIVTCTKVELDGTEAYTAFFHEADMVLHTVSGEYEDNKITAAEATEAMRPYRQIHPHIFGADFDSEEEGGWEWLAARPFRS
jgi:hypothetical protein